jgi:hypothetical protein
LTKGGEKNKSATPSINAGPYSATGRKKVDLLAKERQMEEQEEEAAKTPAKEEEQKDKEEIKQNGDAERIEPPEET